MDRNMFIKKALCVALFCFLGFSVRAFDPHAFTNMYYHAEDYSKSEVSSMISDLLNVVDIIYITNYTSGGFGYYSEKLPVYGTPQWTTNWSVLSSIAAEMIPTPDNPYPNDNYGKNTLGQALLTWESSNMRVVPMDELFAHRSTIPFQTSAPRVTKTITLTDLAKCKYQSVPLGIYAAPGEVIRVSTTLPNVENKNLEIVINHNEDADSSFGDSDKPLYQMPSVKRRFPLTSSVECGSVMGGLVLLYVPYNSTLDTITLTFENVVEAPHFVLGEMTNEEWLGSTNRLRDCYWTVIESPRVKFIHTTQHALQLSEINEYAMFYHRTMQKMKNLYAYGKNNAYFQFDDFHEGTGRSTMPQYRHAHTSAARRTFKTLSEVGDALYFHEYGHIIDENVMIDGFNEWMNNLSDVYNTRIYLPYSGKGNYFPMMRIRQYLPVLDRPDFMSTGDRTMGRSKLALLTALGDLLGWDNYVSAMALVKDKRTNNMTNQDMLDNWLVSFGETTGYDISPFLESWQWSLTDAAKAQVADLRQFNGIEMTKMTLVTKKNTAITFEDPTNLAYSYDGILQELQIVVPQHGSLEANANGTYTYTPEVDFIGDDVISFSIENGLSNSVSGEISVKIVSSADFPTIEFGEIQASTDWVTVDLDYDYESMVVVAQPVLDPVNILPVVTRIRNAEAGHSFEVKLQLVGTNSVSPITCPIKYMVVEEGVYSEAVNGIKMEVLKANSAVTDTHGNWEGIRQEFAYQGMAHYQKPVIFGQVMSYNDPKWSVFWSGGDDIKSFDPSQRYRVGRHVGRDSDQARMDETIGYILMDDAETVQFQFGRVRFQVGNVDHSELSLATEDSELSVLNIAPIEHMLVQGSGKLGVGYWAVLTANTNLAENETQARLMLDPFNGDAENPRFDVDGGFIAAYEQPYTAGAVEDDYPEVLINKASMLYVPNPTGGDLSVLSVQNGLKGTATLNGSGKLVYVPGRNEEGLDIIQYTVTDGENTYTNTITVNIVSKMNASDLDEDHDGLSKFEEYIVGTDPSDASSTFKVRTHKQGNGMTVQWSSLTNRTYTVLSTENLAEPFTVVADGLNQDSYIDQNQDSDQKFYKVKVQMD